MNTEELVQAVQSHLSTYPDMARAATIAVLRELAASFGEDYLNGGDIQDLADEI